jgi:histidinol-phosphatase (PHP family)
MIDLHIHTSRCRHAVGTVGDYVQAARAAGISTMCFTDHLPLPGGYPDCYAMGADELPAYIADVHEAAALSTASGGPEVLCGAEADWVPESPPLIAAATASLGLDVVLGSVHFVEGWAFDDPEEVGGYQDLDIDGLWTRYFEQVCKAVASGLFDVLAHPDLVKKFGFFPEADPTDLYEETARTLAANGVAVEVNTAGLRKPVREIYPALPLLTACRRRGVPATMGSDAHAPGEVGAGLTSARELLLAAGFTSVLVFRSRVPQEVAL